MLVFNKFENIKIFSVFILIFICIFDPSNNLFGGAKFVFYIFTMLLTIYDLHLRRYGVVSFSTVIYTYLLLFIVAIPGISSISTFLSYDSGCLLPEIFQAWKPFLFMFFILALDDAFIKKFEQILMVNLGVLSIIIVVILIICMANTSIGDAIFVFGSQTDNFGIGPRTYGGITYISVFFKASILLNISVCYWFMKCLKKVNFINVFLFLLNDFAFLVSGIRNNILSAILAPIICYLLFSKSKHKFLVMLIICCLLLVVGSNVLMDMFSSTDKSNDIKMSYLNDYMRVLDSSKNLNLFFGSGFGSFFYTGAHGCVSVTELTLFEIVRVFGIFMSLIIIILYIYPVLIIYFKKMSASYYVSVAFIFYLLGCLTNPLLFSSTGFIMFSFILSKVFIESDLNLRK